jgi:hypothetical protein
MTKIQEGIVKAKHHRGNPLDANQVVEGQEMSRKILM